MLELQSPRLSDPGVWTLSHAAQWVLLLVVFSIYLLLVAQGFGPWITDDHSFRQTQTALTALYFRGWQDLVFYQTPVLGPPWAMPFEFPLYQAMVRGLHEVTALSLETSGRLVAISFFLGCLWPLWSFIRYLGVGRPGLVLAPILLSPLYVFWSRAFTIETTALFFTLAYAWLVIDFMQAHNPRKLTAVTLVVAGTLAMLVKVTTALPVIMALALWSVWYLINVQRARYRGWRRLFLLGLLHLPIMALAYAWLGYADAVKAAHPVAYRLTSAALADWNFGPWSQRFELETWFALANNTVDMFFPFSRRELAMKASLSILLATVSLVFFLRCDHSRRWQIGLLVALFVLPFMIFTNLHRVHNYYQVANGVFLCLALGLAIQGALENARTCTARMQIAALGGVLAISFILSSLHYLNAKSSHVPSLAALTALIQTSSESDTLLAIAQSGGEWSSQLPYQAGRRALTVPYWLDPPAERRALAALSEKGGSGALYVACTDDAQTRERHCSALGVQAANLIGSADGCRVYRVPQQRP
jgi:hypothetical protein